MAYEATIEFKFNATESPTKFSAEVFIPEQQFTLTAPAHDLNTKQMFKLFERFMLASGYAPCSIRSGAMSLVFNDWANEEEQRKICDEYDLTMNEDLQAKFKEMQKFEESIAQATANIGTGK